MRRWVFSGPLKGHGQIKILAQGHKDLTIWDFGLFFSGQTSSSSSLYGGQQCYKRSQFRKEAYEVSNQLQFLKGVLDGIKDLEERETVTVSWATGIPAEPQEHHLG